MYRKYNVIGVDVNALTISDLNKELLDIVSKGEKKIIAHHNLHSVYLVKKQPDIKEFWEMSHVTHIDGMPLVWWARILGYDLKRANRITYLDWIYPLMDLANENYWKIYYLGGKPGIATKASTKLNKLFPNITFHGHSGYFNMETNSEENFGVLESINEFDPNILMVGMGMPRQEKWIINNFDKVSANAVLSSGACFDYIAGEQKVPPRFLGKICLEWLYRFVNDPKRLFKRYIVEPIFLIPVAVKDIRSRYFN